MYKPLTKQFYPIDSYGWTKEYLLQLQSVNTGVDLNNKQMLCN